MEPGLRVGLLAHGRLAFPALATALPQLAAERIGPPHADAVIFSVAGTILSGIHHGSFVGTMCTGACLATADVYRMRRWIGALVRLPAPWSCTMRVIRRGMVLCLRYAGARLTTTGLRSRPGADVGTAAQLGARVVAHHRRHRRGLAPMTVRVIVFPAATPLVSAVVRAFGHSARRGQANDPESPATPTRDHQAAPARDRA